MLMHRTIGISLAFLVISAGAMAKTPEKTASHHPGQPHGAEPQKSGAAVLQIARGFEQGRAQPIAGAIRGSSCRAAATSAYGLAPGRR